MRENRTYGSEGGGIETNRSFLPLSSQSATIAELYFVQYFSDISAKDVDRLGSPSNQRSFLLLTHEPLSCCNLPNWSARSFLQLCDFPFASTTSSCPMAASALEKTW